MNHKKKTPNKSPAIIQYPDNNVASWLVPGASDMVKKELRVTVVTSPFRTTQEFRRNYGKINWDKSPKKH